MLAFLAFGVAFAYPTFSYGNPLTWAPSPPEEQQRVTDLFGSVSDTLSRESSKDSAPAVGLGATPCPVR